MLAASPLKLIRYDFSYSGAACMDTNPPDLVFQQSSREHLSSLCDRLFRFFLHSLVEYRLAQNDDELNSMLAELDRSTKGDLGESLNRFIVARFLTPTDRPLMLRPRQYVRQIRSIDREVAAAWDEICSISSLILVYRNNHQHQPNIGPSPTRDLLLVSAIVRLHELSAQLLPSDSKTSSDNSSFYREVLLKISGELQAQRHDGAGHKGARNNLSSSQREIDISEDAASETVGTLSRLNSAGCLRLFSAVFGIDENGAPRLRDSSNEFRSKMKVNVAESLSLLSEEERDAILSFFFDDGDFEEEIDRDLIQKALRKLRHPSRSERLRVLLTFACGE